MQNKTNKKKRAYEEPKVLEKGMTGAFLRCEKNGGACPPGSQLRKSGTCLA